MNWADLKANFLKSPKTTLTGICGAAIAIILAIVALPPKATATVIALAILRAIVDFTKTDTPADAPQAGAAIRFLASAVEDGDNDTMRHRVNTILCPPTKEQS